MPRRATTELEAVYKRNIFLGSCDDDDDDNDVRPLLFTKT
jgi:hypothetical protein